MASANASSTPARVLVCVPTVADAGIIERTILQAGGECVLCVDIESLSRKIADGADVVVVSEEMLGSNGVGELRHALANQPEWSEVPVLLLAAGGGESLLALEARQQLVSVVLLDRPVRLAALETSLGMAFRSRWRQRQIRDLLEERMRLNAELERRLEDLWASERRFRLFVENVREYALLQTDLEGRVTSWNPGAERLFGYLSAEMLGQPITRLLTPEDRTANLLGEELACLSAGERKEDARWLVRRDGSRFWARWIAEPVNDENGRFRGVAKVLRDETGRRQAEEALRQAQKLESIGLLAGGIAHDFNNLLTTIMGNASLVLEDDELRSTEEIETIIRSAERGADLTRQLLAYAGQGEVVVQDIDVSHLVSEMSDLLQSSIPKSAGLKINLEKRLPLVRMDASQLQQILMNLAINAGEAIGEGNPGSITISTALSEVEKPFIDTTGQEIAAGRYVSIEVADTGAGMDENTKSRIFDPFFSTKFTGRGLGLAAVAGIIRTQEGAITVDAKPGTGSTFRVLLPVAEDRLLVSTRKARKTRRATVLVIDDEPGIRKFIGSVVSRRGYRVLFASNGRDALTACEKENGAVNAAIVDVVMPVMGAKELLPLLKESCPKIKILLTSGYGEAEAKRLCAVYPGIAFIQKPYTGQQIAKALENLLKRGR